MLDSQIVSLYWDRNEDAIQETQAKYGGYCFEISANILSDRQDVQECLNDTWLQTWNSIPQNRPASLKAYVGRIARNLSLNRYKFNRRKRRSGTETDLVYEELAEMLGQEDTILMYLEKQEFIAFVTSFLGALSGRERRLFILRFWYLKPVQEIAADLGIREKEAYNRLYRIRREFQKKWMQSQK